MKKILALVLIMFSIVICPENSYAQMKKLTNKQKKELLKMAVSDKVEKGQIKININRIIPIGGTPRNTADQYSLDLVDGKLGCYLPYFGSSSSAPIGSQDISIRTENQEVEYTVEHNEKKGSYTIKFEFENDNMHNKCDATIKISATGICTIHINCTHMSGMDYNGAMRL